jgi:predicted ferric reductase
MVMAISFGTTDRTDTSRGLSPERATAPRTARPLRPPTSSMLGTDVLALVAALAVAIVGIWAVHGGLGALTDGWSSASTSVAQLSGLLASSAGLAGVVLAARPRAIDGRYGLDRMLIWHRYLGESMALLLVVHIVAGIIEWAPDAGVFGAIRDLTGREPYMAMATVGALLVGVVTISSLRSVRRQMSYETWYLVHLLAYGGLALSFMHEVFLGGDFTGDRPARWFWIGLHLAALSVIVWGRWGRLVSAIRQPLRIVSRREVGPGTVEITLGGRALRAMRGDAGQFVMIRPMVSRLWWQAHPFSLSAAPTTAALCLTVKDRGDASGAIITLPVGTKVAVEGPYGACTPDVLGDRRPLFVVGGVGIAPVRAILERLAPGAEPVVLYRAHSEADLVHLDELRALTARLGGRLHTLVGPTASLAVRDPFSAPMLTAVVPDLRDRTAVLCGPERLLQAARSGLMAAGLPPSRIHFERPWW